VGEGHQKLMEDYSHIENLLLDYSKIEKTNYKAKVQFYESKQNKISELLPKDKLEFDVDYTNALFELGKYVKCEGILHGLILTVIRDNIFDLDGKDVYQDLLFKKSACHFNIGEPEKCKHILSELIKINPDEANYKNFYKRCFRIEHKKTYRWMGGLVVAIFLVSAIIVPVELLVVKPFYNAAAQGVEFLRNGLIVIALILTCMKEYLFHKSFSKRISELIG